MKIKKEYRFNNNRQIWRLLPAGDKLVIEERDINSKEVFFNCIEIKNGKKILKNYQLDEKYWAGIEIIYKDIIFFHKFAKPEMPGHKGILAFDLLEQKIIWQSEDYSFLFIHKDVLYSYKQHFEGRSFYKLDYHTGNLIEELGSDASYINKFREEGTKSSELGRFLFPQHFINDKDEEVNSKLNEFKANNVITGKIEYIKNNNHLFFNTHEVNSDGTLKNIFYVIDLKSDKIIFETILNSAIKAFVPDSFFINNNFIILLKEKTELVVYSFKQ